MNNKATSLVAWLGLIFSIVALILAWQAYNQSDSTLAEDITAVDQLEDNYFDLQMDVELGWARLELIELRDDISFDNEYAEALTEVTEINTELDETYADNTLDIPATLVTQFEELETALQNENAVDSRAELEDTITLIEQEIDA